MRVVGRLALALVVAGSAALPTISGSPSASAAVAGATKFVPLGSPTRIVDSRTGLGTAAAPLSADTSRDIQITGGVVPANATAVLINVTADAPKAGGWLQVLPTGVGVVGASSTLNLDLGGVTLPNAAFTPLGNGGQLTVHSTFETDLVIDVFGYFVPATSSDSGRLVTVTPARILDTRSRLGWAPANPGDSKDCASFATTAAAQDWYEAHVDLFGDVARLDADGDGLACEPSETAPAATPAAPTPVVPVAPTPSKPANPGNSKDCGDFGTYAEAKAWFDLHYPYYGDVARLDADDDGLPCESLPGGPSSVTVPLPNAKVLGGTTLTVQVTGRGGIPTTGVSAVVLNVTAVLPKANGWVQVAPTPVTVGASSNLNTTVGVTVANLVVVPVSSTGKIDIHSTTGGDLLADVFGYFTAAGSPVSDGGLFVPLTPDRALDTRSSTNGLGQPAGSTTALELSTRLPNASAFTGNLTSANSKPNGYLQLGPVPLAVGAHSNVNSSYEDQTVANAFVSPLGTNSKAVQIYSLYAADILLDITGYFTTATPG